MLCQTFLFCPSSVESDPIAEASAVEPEEFAAVEEPIVTEPIVESSITVPITEPVPEPAVESPISEPTVEPPVSEHATEAPEVIKIEEPIAPVVESGKICMEIQDFVKRTIFCIISKLRLTSLLSSYIGIAEQSPHL